MADSNPPAKPPVPDHIAVAVIPKLPIPIPPYSNTTFTYQSNADVTIVFLRVPMLTDAQSADLVASGKNEIEGDYITSVTIPLAGVKSLADRLMNIAAKKSPDGG